MTRGPQESSQKVQGPQNAQCQTTEAAPLYRMARHPRPRGPRMFPPRKILRPGTSLTGTAPGGSGTGPAAGPAVGGPKATPAVVESMQYQKPDLSGSEDGDGRSAAAAASTQKEEPVIGGSEPAVRSAAAAASTQKEEPVIGGSEPAVGGSRTETVVDASMDIKSDSSESEHADGGSVAEEDPSYVRELAADYSSYVQEFDDNGHRIRHDTTNMQALSCRMFFDRTTGRYYNVDGHWVDRKGRFLPHRGPPGKYRSKGRNSVGNWNPGGRGANPPHVQERFGERSRLPSGASASRSPPEAGPAHGGQRGPPWHRPAGGGPSDWSQWRPWPAHGGPSRPYSTGPRQDSHRSYANRSD